MQDYNHNNYDSRAPMSSSHSSGRHKLLIMPSPAKVRPPPTQKRQRTSSTLKHGTSKSGSSRSRSKNSSSSSSQPPKRMKWQRWKDCVKGNEKEWCLRMLTIVENDPSSASFRVPIPDTELFYHQSTKKPMDLQTMYNKAQGSGYRSISGFLDDFNLIVNNCRAFNDASSPLHEAANTFERKWKTTVGQNAKEAMAMTKSTLTLRKLNGLGSAWRNALAKKEKNKNAGSNSRGGGRSRSKNGTKSGTKRGANGQDDKNDGGGGKRRRVTSTADQDNDDDQDDESKQPDLTASEYQWCCDTLTALTEHPLSLPFLDPVDDTIVSYHNVIKQPMDFTTMAINLRERPRATTSSSSSGGAKGNKKRGRKAKIKVDHTNGYYRTKTAFLKDLRLIFSNCKTFNADGSDLYADVVELERSLDTRLGIEQHRRRYAANRMTNDALTWCSTVLHKMRCHKDAFPFQMPVDKSFKDYHRKIKKPIDFMTLGRRLHEGMYPDRIAFCNQMKLIFHNCRLYNPSTSPLCHTANKLEKFFHTVVPESMLAEEAERLRKEDEANK